MRHQYADASHLFILLRTRGTRPSNRRTAEKRDELAPPHRCPRCHAERSRSVSTRTGSLEGVHQRYSITSSARASSDGGTVRFSTLAVFRLMTKSIFVACWTGKSAGFSPFKIRPV